MDRSRKRNRQRCVSSSFHVLWLCWFYVLMLTRTIIKCQAQSGNEGGHAFLTEDSVVLITGAAGFLGSELALALHQTYSPKRIICVDRMGDHPESTEDLVLFEFQRQRSFNVMQTLGEKGRFYRSDFTPMIPEYYDQGEVPVLDHIFRENLDITHVVHLADPFPHSALQAVPREKDVPKAGMMESLLEQLAKHEREGHAPPNFVYASSHEVYPHHKDLDKVAANISLEETQTLSTPSSLRGAAKMMDEMIAKLYYDTKGIYSVGLRFFSVYGPWGAPGSPLFEMAERAVSGNLDGLDTSKFHSGLNGIDIDDKGTDDDGGSPDDSWKKLIHDFVYIDDAVDAIMAAMQFRSAPTAQNSSPHPIIFNVGSGAGHSLEDVLEVMQEFFPPEGSNKGKKQSSSVSSNLVGAISSTKRAETLLGYQPKVSLREGIIKLLAWHFDRLHNDRYKKSSKSEKLDLVLEQGMTGCLPFDKECLRGFPVFPCASECSHKDQCTKSYYDEVIALTTALTSSCKTVLYTVDLNNSLISLPSASKKFQKPKYFLKGTCNLAFVSQQSLLYQNKQRELSFDRGSKTGRDGQHFRDGPWVLIPLRVVSAEEKGDASNTVVGMNEILKLLPKLSPGLFFESKTTKRAIYTEPNVVISNIQKLIVESYAQPYSEETEGATAMLIGRGTPKNFFANDDDDDEEMILKLQDPNYQHQNLEPTNSYVQNSAYRMIKIAVQDNLFGDGLMEVLDSSWIVHGLESDDERLFRCDVFGEIVLWEVTSDKFALEFILGLHDMWSRVIVKSSGTDPWWVGDDVVTVPQGQRSQAAKRRRLQEDEVAVVDTTDRKPREEKEVAPLVEDAKDEPQGNEADDDELTDAEEEIADETVRGEFVADAVAQKEVTVNGEKRGDSPDEVQEKAPVHKEIHGDEQELERRDFSSFDTWMGIISSSEIKYFVRIIPSDEVGIISVDKS